MMEVSLYASSKFVLPKVLYLPKCAVFSAIGQIQHSAVKYGNKNTLTIDLTHAKYINELYCIQGAKLIVLPTVNSECCTHDCFSLWII